MNQFQEITHGEMFRLVEKFYGNNAAVNVMIALKLGCDMCLMDWVELFGRLRKNISNESPAFDLFWSLAGDRPHIRGLFMSRKLKGDTGSYEMMLRFIAADKGATVEELESIGKPQ